MSEKSIKQKSIGIGVCYYPEHWDESLWADDLSRMQKAGIGTIRIADFAWAVFEPSEGEYSFDLFDRFLSLAAKTDIKVIFCTATPNPPVWMSENYPEILNADMDGHLYRHGARRHYNYNSRVYREKVAALVTALAQHYGKNPSIIGWQIDNELNAESNRFYSDSDTIAFREFLKNKYSSLDALNDAWGTRFWSQTYFSWSEIYVPRRTTNGAVNPHLMLDYLRFISASVISFVKLQSDILRKYIKPDDFITTNGMFPDIDNHEMTDECLDFYMYDSYPNFSYGTSGRVRDNNPDRWYGDRGWSDSLTETRSISPNFGIMEQQSGANGWNIWGLSPVPKPGQVKLWTMQSIAHGADFVSYFRWRTCTYGTEIYWHGILNYDNKDSRILSEITDIHRLTTQLNGLAGGKYKALFGVITDTDNTLDAEYDNWHSPLIRESSDGIFKSSQKNHIPFDYVPIKKSTTAAQLAEYPVLFYPHPIIYTERINSLLKEYVSLGGKLIFGCRTGYKDECGRCRMMVRPCLAAELCGIQIEDGTATAGGDEVAMINFGDTQIPAGIYNDIIVPDAGTEILGTYAPGTYYSDRPAFTRRAYDCGGEVYYFGGTFREDTVTAILSYLGLKPILADVIEAPSACELAVRGDYLFVLNYSAMDVDIKLSKALYNVESEAFDCGSVTMPQRSVLIYKI